MDAAAAEPLAALGFKATSFNSSSATQICWVSWINVVLLVMNQKLHIFDLAYF